MDRCRERRQRLFDHGCRHDLLDTDISIIRKESPTCGWFDRRLSDLLPDLEMRPNPAAAVVGGEIQEGLTVLRHKSSDEVQRFDLRWFGLGNVREGDARETMADEHDWALFATERGEERRVSPLRQSSANRPLIPNVEDWISALPQEQREKQLRIMPCPSP